MFDRVSWRQRFWAVEGPLLLALISGMLGPVTLPFSPAGFQASDEFMARQAQALRPEFRGDLDGLANAPRYALQATVDLAGATISAQLQLQYTNTTGHPLSQLAFRLFPNARTIYGGGSLTVHEVKRGDAVLNAQLSAGRTVLYVPLDPGLAPGETTTLNLAFTTQIPTSWREGYAILYRGRYATTLSGWYPILAAYRNGWQEPPVPTVGDATFTEAALYDVTLTVPESYTVVATGTPLGVDQRNGNKTWHIVTGPIRTFAAALSEDYQQLQAEVRGVKVNYWFVGTAGGNSSAQEGLSIASSALAAYMERFGPYPFTELDVAETPVTIGGYEFMGLVFIDRDERVEGRRGDYSFLIAHEVGHQWWYGLVGNDQVLNPWLDESLATYATVVRAEATRGPAAGRSLLASFARNYGWPGPGSPPITSSALDFGNWAGYRAPVYYHGALFLDALRQQMGDAKFFEFLQRYAATYRYRIATTADFMNLAREVSGQDLGPLFERWFGTANPT